MSLWPAEEGAVLSAAAFDMIAKLVGFATVLCGPGCIDQANQPNAYIEKSQAHACIDFMRRLIDAQAS
ncbi:MAG: hypothetical protein BMS9Abin01_1607 [Gammaproteobacteria bacterium]|nr:MAG: hypothetical protein BMS9Abin01_1607 [Gammaproteobacteria bacterium]